MSEEFQCWSRSGSCWENKKRSRHFESGNIWKKRESEREISSSRYFHPLSLSPSFLSYEHPFPPERMEGEKERITREKGGEDKS